MSPVKDCYYSPRGVKSAFTVLHVFTKHATQGQLVESVHKVWKDPQSVGVCTPHLPGRLSEWVRGRDKPATHKTLYTDLVIKPQSVG